jgi:hypothetical protein
MKKLLAPLLLLFALCAWAADFWQKPPDQWSDKDVQKMLTNSPWAREYTLSLPPGQGFGDAGGGAPEGGGGGGGRGGRGGGGGGGGEGGGGGGAPGSTNVQQMPPQVIVRWQSALPIRQAFVRVKFGAQAGTSPEAKQIVDRAEMEYVIVLSGNLKRLLMPSPTLQKDFMAVSELSVKGKDPVRPSAVDIALQQDANDMVFHFPRTTPFTADDKEIEFETKFGQIPIKVKFKPKEMVYSGKLEM